MKGRAGGKSHVTQACSFMRRSMAGFGHSLRQRGGGAEDLLLDFAWLAGRSGLDLLPGRRQAMGEGHRQHGEHLVPQRRRRLAAGSGARRHRRPGADGIVTTSPDPGSLVDVAKEAHAAHIPIINFNTPDPKASFDAYVGGDRWRSASSWAQYLVDHKLVKKGDFVWMPVEVPGATYGVQEEQGIASVFKPLGITWEVTETTLDQAEVINRMADYLTANRKKIKAIIGLGDLVTGSIKRVFDQVGVKPGEIPVVGWGNSLDTTQEVLNGYVNAAQWQDPQATSYVALSLAAMAASGIPPGFNVITGALYERDTAQIYDEILSGK